MIASRDPVAASARGSIPTRRIAYQVRVVAMVPAFPLANVEFAMARNAITQPMPQASRASWIHGLPPFSAPNVSNRFGPKNTSPAYVPST
jgi:hypothetical protein